MASVVPTVLASTPVDYAERIDRVKPFAKRLHIDVCDGIFADNKTLGLTQIYDINTIPFDLHLMIERPLMELETIISLAPSLVIIHFESEGDHFSLIKELKAYEIKVGLAVLAETSISQVAALLPLIDHLLIFTGYIGHNGGTFQSDQLHKIAEARAIAPNLEIGIDGGVDQSSARLCVEAGVDILDVGSFIHNSNDPEIAYIAISAIADGTS